MTREQEINILMSDRCTKSEAERFLKNYTTIWENPEGKSRRVDKMLERF